MKILLPALSCLLLVGCASAPTQRLSEKSPTFVAMTSGKGMFAVAGVGAAASAGNKLVRENGIEDPALVIGETIAKDLSNQHGVSVSGRSSTIADSDKIDEIVQLALGNDYALDVATNGWSYIYDGFKFSDYFVGYSGEMRLIDVSTSQVVASGMCIYDAKKAGKAAVSHDTLMANNAAYIKDELAAATDSCLQQFRSELL